MSTEESKPTKRVRKAKTPAAETTETTPPAAATPAPTAKPTESGDWRKMWGLPQIEGKTARELAEETKAALEKVAQDAKAVIHETAQAVLPASKLEPPREPLSEAAETSEPAVEVEPEVAQETSGTFKSFLIPYVLLLLRDGAIHGYAIWERLMLMSIPGLSENDRVNIYRALRQLEKEGKIKSQWETTGTGPARRVYVLTNAGENFLNIWATGLRQYRQSLDFFFKMYTGGTLPNLFNGGLFASAKRKSEGEL